MLYTKLFPKTLRKIPKNAQVISHRFLVQAGYISQLSSGIWSLLPLGWRVYKKIENIIRQEMNTLGAQEVFLPSLIPKELWQETRRWGTMDPPLFKLIDRHNKWYGLGSTHEEVITDLIRKFIKSYADLPLALYQIQNKFRNEMRPTGGLLRTKEFVMKDLYSFHKSEDSLEKFYQKVYQSYKRIYRRCGLNVVAVEALSGSIGGTFSHEFMALAESGEDKILYCPKCGWGMNVEVGRNIKLCPKCGTKLEFKNSIEVGHIFKLGTNYSKKMGAYFMDKDGKKKLIIMGCYGIGLQRLLATIVEVNHDEQGIIWPKNVSPFDIHLVGLNLKNKSVDIFAKSIYTKLEKKGFDVLYDDRDESPGVKLKDADLIGIPIRLLVSKKTKKKIEYKERKNKKAKLLTFNQVINYLK